ncbi:enoyl-CoA hydratase-related protein [Luminiphilus syltensis]|uniref:enoyl-CoA hydratase-related protein n=1 Tax=Luminiphilus syltensis TaxID=1341119 RepID=UPI0002D35BE5|nr:enoyl-CoA hydratase-related protein [Luminiphilus syltensis]
MSEASPEVVFAIKDHGIALVTINRTKAGNSVSPEVTATLYEAVQRVDEDESLRVAILTGAGDTVFCAGADLRTVSEGRGQELVHPSAGFAGFVNAKPQKPWIVAVNGAAMGGGLELALTADMVVAAEHATFGLPEVKVGVAALAGGIYRLPRAIPRAIAMEMIATGAPISARRGYELGLINRVVPADQLIEEAMGLARQIAANAPISVLESLQLARQTYDKTEAELLDMNAAVQQRVMSTEDAKEGSTAFVEKRKPVWKGR